MCETCIYEYNMGRGLNVNSPGHHKTDQHFLFTTKFESAMMEHTSASLGQFPHPWDVKVETGDRQKEDTTPSGVKA